MLAEAFIGLLVGHYGGDQWGQSNHQANTKGSCGRAGRRACAAHVATLTLFQAAALALVAIHEGGLPLAQAALGLALNALSHYWADRRRPLEGLALALQRFGKHDYYVRSDASRIALDQAFHKLWLLPSALIIAAPTIGQALLLTGASLAVLAALDQFSRRGWARHRAHTTTTA